ncbi:hypothetical protein LINPERPRIM_LOCUS5339 [Linum perenne]
MDRQSSEPTITKSSSIALLQERFRKLEQAREMRQQHQFFRVFADAEQEKSNASVQEASIDINSDLFPSSSNKPLRDPSLHLQSTIHGQYSDLQVKETPDLENLHSSNVLMHTQYKSDESDVDTSLHL